LKTDELQEDGRKKNLTVLPRQNQIDEKRDDETSEERRKDDEREGEKKREEELGNPDRALR
jgi:hypothetical protein